MLDPIGSPGDAAMASGTGTCSTTTRPSWWRQPGAGARLCTRHASGGGRPHGAGRCGR
jgi:hypothetical protein